MKHNPIIIAIDGFSSSGKSTMARQLAKTIGYRYIDSGAMYRAVTLYALSHGMISDSGSIDRERLIADLDKLTIDFAVKETGQRTLLNGKDVEDDIRGMTVSNHVSAIAAIPQVRHALVRLQQQFGRSKGIVMDGRDIGTTVFPDAELKIYVCAPAAERARRRYEELRAKDVETTYDEVLENVVSRDHVDMTRAESPLRKADDAIELDNGRMTPEQQDRWLIQQFNDVQQRLADN